MSRRAALLVAFVVGIVVIVAVVALRPNEEGPVDPTATPSADTSLSAGPTLAASASPSTVPTATPTAETTPTPSPTPDPTPRPTATPEPDGDARLRYAQFLLRVNDDRDRVTALNDAVRAGAQAQDDAAVRDASVDILDFVDSERVWLREHPPASCYADAHASADDMLVAYGTAADRFIDWTTATGLDRLAALTDALDAADQAGEALTAFGRGLEATTCQT